MFFTMNKEEIIDFFKDTYYQIKSFSQNDIIAIEGDECVAIGIVLSGSIDIKRMLSNKVIQMTSFGPGHLFGEVIIFSDVNKYPATVISSSKSEILFISRENFKQFTYTHPDFLEMFLRDLSNKILTLNKNTLIENTTYSIKHAQCIFRLINGECDSNAPTTGTWNKGEKVWNKDVGAGKYIGWVCISSGTPGTWKGFGLIES